MIKFPTRQYELNFLLEAAVNVGCRLRLAHYLVINPVSELSDVTLSDSFSCVLLGSADVMYS